MKRFFGNIWTKRFASLIVAFYTFAVCYLCYCSVFYTISIDSRVSLCLSVIAVSFVALVIMLYSRKMFLTKLSSVLILPAMLPVVLFYFGEWEMIIPIIVTGICILLLSGAGEGFKTAFGTIFLLMYIFGALGYFLITSFFVTSTESVTVESGVSPSGLYRYSIINTEDTSNGSTSVSVEPNDADVSFPFVTFQLKNIDRVVYLERPIAENPVVEWTTQTRSEITAELNSISDTISVHLTEDQLEELGYTYDNKLVLSELNSTQKESIGKTSSDIESVPLDELTDDQLLGFGIGRNSSGRYYILNPSAELLEEVDKKTGETVYVSEMSSDEQSEYNIEKDDSVLLSTLSDDDLAMIGVPESGDVMTYNGKVCFRYYVAILEDYFDVDDRTLSFSLLG